MNIQNNITNILKELQENATKIDDNQAEQLIDKIVSANHIFLQGAGRSGAVVATFANRLLHLGLSVSLVGEISSPHSKAGDLLIICSGSGETDSLKSLAQKAVTNNVDIALVTAKKESTIGHLAETVLVLPSKVKSETTQKTSEFSQAMGSSFVQLAFLTFEGLVLSLMTVLAQTNETMLPRHADFE
ncbi:6-phospho-3-hexuloisomerase [Lactococcus hodotermopsidis]|uniref:6-phospho-3-hexuloisomerase n=1 Tax=Pseudolactococcus hodotermopsidis TaxID=2709157 RepID=A0A6A0BA97_9LACT|nr:6-phospho-3-hexuloisomerase [Lactococcus hodotermopsidis]GFH42312.1 6-phospho-3-hexuloisomerase [Lactococcus hodotermopsidis]